MLTKEQAQALAAWVNEHDDGTPQPRAEEFASPTGGSGVRIRSQAKHLDGTQTTETDTVYSVSAARLVLGY